MIAELRATFFLVVSFAFFLIIIGALGLSTIMKPGRWSERASQWAEHASKGHGNVHREAAMERHLDVELDDLKKKQSIAIGGGFRGTARKEGKPLQRLDNDCVAGEVPVF